MKLLKYLDESGFCLCLPPAYTWTLKGRAYQHLVKTRWGGQRGASTSSGHCASRERMSYWSTRCSKEDAGREGGARLPRRPGRESPRGGGQALCVVVLDNAPFHRAGVLSRNGERDGKRRGLGSVLPASLLSTSEPHRGRMEETQGFSHAPRRYYDTLADLKEAVLSALRMFEAVEVHSQLGGT